MSAMTTPPRERPPRARPSESPLGAVAACLIALVVSGLYGEGLLRPIDDGLAVARAKLLTRAPSGAVATVEIDSTSLKAVGVWPWPRSIHARLLDRLMAMGAHDVAFDIDFSAESTPAEDSVFAAALHRAGGFATLAAFEQTAGADGGTSVNAPIARFAAEADIAAVDVPVDSDNVVRRYQRLRPVGGRLVPTLGAVLSGVDRGGGSFALDTSIDLARLDRMSAAAVLDGSLDAARVRGKSIVVGASAQELRDLFFVPRFGLIPGAVLHALAAETLREGAVYPPWPRWATYAGLLAMAVAVGLLGRLRSPTAAPRVAAVAFISVETAAMAIQALTRAPPDTAALDLLLLGLALAAIVADWKLRRDLHQIAARERDSVQAMLSAVVADNFDGVVVLNEAGAIIAVSRFADDLVGPGLIGANASNVLPTELAEPLRAAFRAAREIQGRNVVQGECTLRKRGGNAHVLDYVITVSTVDPGSARQVACLTLRDVTQKRAAEAKLAYVATHDDLTGALLRQEFLRAAEAGLAKRAPMTLVRVDLRRFELVNEVFGHAAGDELLRVAAWRLEGEGVNALARLSGDGFAVAKWGDDDPAAFGARLARRLAEPYRLGDNVAMVGACAGATTTAISGFDPETLLVHASMAQASVKRGAGVDFAVFSPDFETQRREKQQMERDLRIALAHDELCLVYQPKIDLKTGRIVGAEALMRWRRADGRHISPAKFIPLAEESGFVVELGRWALRQACAAAAHWPDGLRVAVNVSPIQFAATDVAQEVKSALAEAGLAADRLEVELTEGVFVDEASQVNEALGKLRALGVTVAIDDFGTGYSSLHYLGRLPIDVIKIDKAFVAGIPDDERALATAGAILSLAATHKKSVVAEGVETEAQARALRAAGCGYAQGFYFGGGVSAAQLAALAAAPIESAA